jgi:3-oxochol-4-en-24-oyl-CoA dehydrogenase
MIVPDRTGADLMSIAVTEEHQALAEAVRRWAADRCPPAVPRALLDADAETASPVWDGIAAQGWLGLHVAEEHGGAGYGLEEAAVVLEGLGRAMAPGPVLPTVLAAEVVQRHASAALRKEVLASLADGSAAAAAAWSADGVRAEASADGWVLSGTAPRVLGAGLADVLVLGALGPDGEVWVVLDVTDVTVRPLRSVDATRRVADVVLDGVGVGADRVLEGTTAAEVADLAATLLAAEAAGVAAWCLDTATAYARTREQFGRVIGQFQAVKHRCADMLVAVEQARAVAWDAARAAADPGQRPLVAAVAAAVAPEAAWRCAKDAVQVLGGIGFTWEHDAHVYLKRATAVRQLLAGPGPWRARTATLALGGDRRRLDLDLGDAAVGLRAEVRAVAESVRDLGWREQRTVLADGGWLAPHWPAPYGRGAAALEQLVIDDEFRAAGVHRPHLQIGAWVVPTLIAHGTPAQRERFVGPTLRGEISWCQMFSEPGAGSDLAALSTRAERVEGGWSLTGQKVWTSLAQQADHAICLARTGPPGHAAEGARKPRHHLLPGGHVRAGHRHPPAA